MSGKIILGIDPGTTIMGYGIISVKGENVSLIDFDDFSLKKLDNHYLKLKKIFSSLSLIIEKYNPDEIAIEAPFFGKNVQSMLKLGRAQGVAMAAALYREIPIFEYAPKKIKLAITGKGTSSKIQVAAMLKSLLNLNEIPSQLDASDGLAAAVCHYLQKNNAKSTKDYSSWKSYIQENPKKIK